MRQTRLLDLDEVSILVLVGERAEMDHAGDSGGDQPWETHQTIDQVEESTETEIVVICFTVLEFVTLVSNEMPGDSIIEVDKKETKNGRSRLAPGT